jgi:uncharacterized membrane protein
VVAVVARDLDAALDRLFPDELRQDESPEASHADGRSDEPASAPHLVVQSKVEGYIQSIDEDTLLELACKDGLLIRLRTKPGAFLAKCDALAAVWRTGGREAGDLSERIANTVITGDRRTPRQDVECAIEELAEVAVRSLSPGINDPFTAIACIDRLGASLGRLARRRMPSPVRSGPDGQPRLIVYPASFAPVLNAALNQVRQAGRSNVAVTIRLLEALTGIAGRARREEDKDAIRRQGEMILRHCEAVPEPDDRTEIRDRHDALTRALGPSRLVRSIT